MDLYDIAVARKLSGGSGGGGGGSSDFIVVLQTINITAQSVTGVYNSDYQVYECIAEIASASAEALADYSYGDLTYNKLLKSGDEVGTFNGVELDRTGFPEDVTSASMYLEGDKWVAWIECVSPFTVTLNPQTIIAYRATEEVADYFGNMSVCY